MTPSIRALVVDDDVTTRVGIRTILTSEPGIDVVGEAATGADACRMADELAPDIVLMDVQLPDLDGIEATRRITSAEGDHPRVVVLTTFDIDEYVYRSLRAGASAFLLKRSKAEDLVDTVRAVADGATLPTPAATMRLISTFADERPERPGPTFVPPLTDRETDVLVLIARGYSNTEIADRLAISFETVRTHVKHVYAKCGAKDRAHAVIAAYESGLVDRAR